MTIKIAIQYSGYLRFIQQSWPLLKQSFISNEEIEFYIFMHTWETSFPEDIEYVKNEIKPHRLFIDKQKDFEKHPYQLLNVDDNHIDYLNNPKRHKWNNENPNNIKHFFEKPSKENNFKFAKDLEVVKFDYYSHYPFNTLSLFYSIHQSALLTNSYAQENKITFDYYVRMRSDLVLTTPIQLSILDNNHIFLFEAQPHKGEQGKYTIHDQFAIGNPKLMNIYTDVFIYLPCYYTIFKLDWVSEIYLGFHLQYNNIPIRKLPRLYNLLRYNPVDTTISRPLF